MTDVILLTGATGFLGTELAAGLIQCPETEKIYALVRAADPEEAAHRLRASWHHEQALYEAVGGNGQPADPDHHGSGKKDRVKAVIIATRPFVKRAITARAIALFSGSSGTPCPNMV